MLSLKKILTNRLTEIISETNGLSIVDTLNLLLTSDLQVRDSEAYDCIKEFEELLDLFKTNKIGIQVLLEHPVSSAFVDFFRTFPLKYNEEHIHLTGAMNAEFIFPRLKALLEGPHKALYEKKITEVYGAEALPIKTVSDVEKLITLQEGEAFSRYLKILYLPKLVLISREAHAEAAESVAEDLYRNYNIGRIRLKFSLNRSTSNSSEQIPGSDDVSSEDVILGLYEGFERFRKKNPDFNYILSPSFRKEASFFDSKKYATRRDHFMAQVNEITALLDKYPYLAKNLCEVDTVGDEREMYRKSHFAEMQMGFRKLQYRGFQIRSHHGETWHTLKKGIQAVDNAMNIWHIDTLEHGISLGINPNVYFQRIYQEVMRKNSLGQPITSKDHEFTELSDLDWGMSKVVFEKLVAGTKLNREEQILFVKAKFHTARDVESYQHDVLNRMIQKGVTLVSLPSSNNKLTGRFEDYKDHPFSWWEKKGVQLGVGTDNHVTLGTNFLQEMVIILLTDPDNLKITKLLMVVTGETRRPYISHLLWTMRKKLLLEEQRIKVVSAD